MFELLIHSDWGLFGLLFKDYNSHMKQVCFPSVKEDGSVHGSITDLLSFICTKENRKYKKTGEWKLMRWIHVIVCRTERVSELWKSSDKCVKRKLCGWVSSCRCINTVRLCFYQVSVSQKEKSIQSEVRAGLLFCCCRWFHMKAAQSQKRNTKLRNRSVDHPSFKACWWDIFTHFSPRLFFSVFPFSPHVELLVFISLFMVRNDHYLWIPASTQPVQLHSFTH